MRLSRDDILKADDTGSEEVNVPEWGGTVLVRGMTGKERDQFEMSVLERGHGGRMVPNPANMRAKVIARCVVDGDGNRLFSEQDIQALGDKNAGALDRVFTVASRLSGLGQDEEDEAKRDFSLANGAGSSSP